MAVQNERALDNTNDYCVHYKCTIKRAMICISVGHAGVILLLFLSGHPYLIDVCLCEIEEQTS